MKIKTLNVKFIDEVEVKEHPQDTLESLAVIVLGVIEFIAKHSNEYFSPKQPRY